VSSYIDFFIRSKSNDLCPIGDFSRNSVIYSLFEVLVPFGEAEPISKQTVFDAQKELENRKEAEEILLKENEELLNKISTFNNSVEEKISAIYDQQDVINEIKETITEYNYTNNYLQTLLDIIDTQPVENEDKYIYAGIEVPEDYQIEVN